MSDFAFKTFTDFKSAEEAVRLFCQTEFHLVHVDANWNHFTQAISASIDECIPSKLTSNRNKRLAWLNAPVRKLVSV